MELISEETRSFYYVIEHIKSFYANNLSITAEDKKKIKELLTALKYKVQFDILDDCLSSDDELKGILEQINSKLEELEKERNFVREQIKDNELITNTRKLVALRKSCDELQRIKHHIESKQFGHYVMEMNQSLESTSDLIVACNQVLSVGETDYTKMFGGTLVENGEVNNVSVNAMFNILLNPVLKREVKDYLDTEAKYLSENKRLEDNANMLELLLLAKRNETTVREYLRARVAYGESHEMDYLAARESLARDRLVLDGLPKDGLAGIFNSKERKLLEARIEGFEEVVRSHEEKLSEASKLEEILFGIGLGDVVEALSNVNYEMQLSVPEKVAYFLKTYVRKETFDIRKIVAGINASNDKIKKEVEVAKADLDDAYDLLTNDAREIINLYHDDAVKLFNLLKDRRKGEFTPILAAYILKALSDARKLDYRDIIDMCELDVDEKELFSIYQRLNKDEVAVLQQQLAQIQEEEDSIEFGEETEKTRKI